MCVWGGDPYKHTMAMKRKAAKMAMSSGDDGKNEIPMYEALLHQCGATRQEFHENRTIRRNKIGISGVNAILLHASLPLLLPATNRSEDEELRDPKLLLHKKRQLVSKIREYRVRFE